MSATPGVNFFLKSRVPGSVLLLFDVKLEYLAFKTEVVTLIPEFFLDSVIGGDTLIPI